MSSDILERTLIDSNLDSYQKFFDHEWAKKMSELVGTSLLAAPLDALMVSWRSANGAHLLPWLMAESLRSFADAELKKEGDVNFRSRHAGRVIQGIVEKIDKRMHYNLKRDQRSALKRVVAKIEQEAYDAMRVAQEKSRFDIDGYWRSLLEMSEFHFCILGTQRINYASLFFAYEDFVAGAIKTKVPNFNSRNTPIKTALAPELRDYCWIDSEVDLARLVRNALAHNGGRFGDDLDKHKDRFLDATGATDVALHDDRFLLVAGKIQITPGNTRHLFGVLKDRVTRIIGHDADERQNADAR